MILFVLKLAWIRSPWPMFIKLPSHCSLLWWELASGFSHACVLWTGPLHKDIELSIREILKIREYPIFRAFQYRSLVHMVHISQKGLWAHNPSLVHIHAVLTWKVAIKLGHNFAHVTTAELSWHVQNSDLIWLSFFTWEQLECLQNVGLSAHMPFVTWSRDLTCP